MSSIYVLLTSVLFALPQIADQQLESQNELTTLQAVSLQTVPHSSKSKNVREIILEVPGITCVSRFTDSLRRVIVKEIDGVNSVNFQYLPRGQKHPFDDELNRAIAEGKAFFGGWGRLVFQVEKDFDDKILLRRLLKSKLYTNTELWVLVQRRSLAELELEN